MTLSDYLISLASSLPVNCGMMFIVAGLKEEDFSDFTFRIENESEATSEIEQSIIDYLENKYPSFSSMGIMSLLLTVANVIMVACGASLMFRAKEVLPVKKKGNGDDINSLRKCQNPDCKSHSSFLMCCSLLG